MKKILTTFLIVAGFLLQGQFVNQLQYKFTMTAHEVDSVLVTQGIPSGVFPINFGAKAYKIIYNTVNWDSVPTTASGLLIVPVGARCRVPIISYQHGTITRKSDALSNLRGEWFLGLAGASKGNVFVMPDYLGLGDGPGLHPYQHAHSEATAVIDMIRAAKEVVDTMGAPVNEQLFLCGYSQGGHATMAAHQLIQQQLDNVMHVTASAPMSGAYSMSGAMVDVMLSDSTYPAPYYLPYLFMGFNEVYHFYANVSDVMIHPYDSILPPLFDGSHGANEIDAVMPQVPKLIMQQVQIDSFAHDSMHFFRVRLRENDTYNWLPNSPMRMYFCRSDRSVSYKNAIEAYQHFIQNGATLVDTLDVNPSLDHMPCAQFAIAQALFWFDSMAYQAMITSVSSVSASSASAHDGSATAHVSGGSGPFTFLWSTGDTGSVITNLSPGPYAVVITDQTQCTQVDAAVVQFITGITDQLLTNIKVYPNPSSGKITIENLDPSDPITRAEMFDMSGKWVVTYSIKQGNTIQLYSDDAAKGIYYLHLKTQNNKELRQKIVLM